MVKKALCETARLLKPGSLLWVEEIRGGAVRWADVFSCSHPSQIPFNRPEFVNWWSQAGFYG